VCERNNVKKGRGLRREIGRERERVCMVCVYTCIHVRVCYVCVYVGVCVGERVRM